MINEKYINNILNALAVIKTITYFYEFEFRFGGKKINDSLKNL